MFNWQMELKTFLNDVDGTPDVFRTTWSSSTKMNHTVSWDASPKEVMHAGDRKCA